MAAKIPDAPLNFENDVAITTAYQIGLLWDEGVYNGGSPVIEYQLSYTEALSNTWSIFASDIALESATITGLTPGTYYKFKV